MSLSKRLYIDDEYKILGYKYKSYARLGSDEEKENKLVQEKWNKKIEKYRSTTESEKILGLAEPFFSMYREVQSGTGIATSNFLIDRCIKFLKESHETKES